MNSTHIMQTANPIDDTAFADSWADPEGKASFERIVADPRTAKAKLPRPRTGRRLVMGTALAGAAGAAVAIVGLPGSPNHGATGAAWAVTKNANGSITVDIRDYRDPAGLQAKLRAAGLRANVVTAPSDCIGTDQPDNAEGGLFLGDSSTFTAPYTWQRLFAGSPSYVMHGPGMGVVQELSNDTHAPSAQPGFETPAHISFTVTPGELPPGDDLTIGFPANGSSQAGHSMVVDVEKIGTPMHCDPPGVSFPPESDPNPTPTS
jgi:hypothetical protein